MTVRTEQDIDVVASGRDVAIRRKRASDATDEYAWRSDPEIARFDGSAGIADSFTTFIEAFRYEMTYGRNGRQAFALDAADGTHIGSIMYYNSDGDSAELGVSIALDGYRGRGVGRAAVTAFLRYIWATTSLRRIYLHVLDWNERAQRCFRACGFEDVARVQRDGQWFIRMEASREWWLLWESRGRFDAKG